MSAEYDFFHFVSRDDFSGPGMLLKSVSITLIDTEPAGVGLCLASLYSPRPGFDNWVHGTLSAGFSAIYVYYTTGKAIAWFFSCPACCIKLRSN